jgi:hypothetical protein
LEIFKKLYSNYDENLDYLAPLFEKLKVMVTMNKNHPPFNPKVQGSNFFLNFQFFFMDGWMKKKM